MSEFDRNISSDLISDETLSDREATNALVAYLQRQLALGSGKVGYLLGMLSAGGWVIGSPDVTGEIEHDKPTGAGIGISSEDHPAFAAPGWPGQARPWSVGKSREAAEAR